MTWIFRITIAVGITLASLTMPVSAQTDEATLVTATEVMSEDISPRIPAAGTVFSRNVTQITGGLEGRIKWIAEPGDFIAAGAAVVIFDCDLLELQREEQLAIVERERVNFKTLAGEAERLESLRATRVASETQLARMQGDRDRAASELRIAGVRVRQTESQLERCATNAPFDGVVTERFHNSGEDVERTTVLAAMTDTLNLEVRASVPVRYLPRIRTGKDVDVRMNNVEFTGRLRRAVPAADPLSQTFQVRIDLPANAPQFVAAGQLVSVELPLSVASVVTVPRDSIVLREDGTFVMRINDNNTVERVDIEIADASGQRVAIRGSLSAGDRIAVRGAESLNDGELVSVHTES